MRFFLSNIKSLNIVIALQQSCGTIAAVPEYPGRRGRRIAMERSLFVNVPWVDLQMAVIWVLALAGLLVVTVRLALEGESQGSRRPAAGHASAHRPVQPLTPEWLERLISGIGHPPAPRPRAVERGDLDREVA